MRRGSGPQSSASISRSTPFLVPLCRLAVLVDLFPFPFFDFWRLRTPCLFLLHARVHPAQASPGFSLSGVVFGFFFFSFSSEVEFAFRPSSKTKNFIESHIPQPPSPFKYRGAVFFHGLRAVPPSFSPPPIVFWIDPPLIGFRPVVAHCSL